MNACLLWLVWCVRNYGEKQRLFAAEAPTSPFCQRQVAHKLPNIFGLCMLAFLFLYACLGLTSYAMQINLFSIVPPY